MYSFFERLVEPFPDGALARLPRRTVPFLWACTQGMRTYIALVMLMTGIIAIFEAYLFNLLGRIVDLLSHVRPENLWQTHKTSIVAILAILSSSILLIGLQSLIKQQTLSGNFAMRLRWNLHRSMLARTMSAYHDDFVGRMTSTVMQTAVAVRDTWMLVIDMLVFIVIYLVTIALVIGTFDAILLVPLVLWMAVTVVAVLRFVPRLSETSRAQAEAHLLTAGRIADTYGNIATVKLFAHTRHEAGYAQTAMRQLLRAVQGQLRLTTGFQILSHLLSMTLIISIAGVALLLWTRGALTVGAVAAASAMALRLNGMSNQIMWQTASLFDQVGIVKAGINALPPETSAITPAGTSPLRVSRGEVVFEHVTFAYGPADPCSRPVIENFNLTIRAGEKVGLVGRSGVGKTTLVNLLLRFYEIRTGRILIDGQDIAHVTEDSLRAQIGMVTQDISLLHRSIRENIAYGKPNATPEELIEAAKHAGAHDFIVGLSDQNGRTGYDAHVGERGVKLSSGQRQRIVIARVLLKNAPILLLDEATSALDSEIEAGIQQNLYGLMQAKTIIAIAHRLSTIAAMDRLVVLDGRRVVEQGTHEALLAKNGLYARLWTHHSGGFLGQ